MKTTTLTYTCDVCFHHRLPDNLYPVDVTDNGTIVPRLDLCIDDMDTNRHICHECASRGAALLLEYQKQYENVCLCGESGYWVDADNAYRCKICIRRWKPADIRMYNRFGSTT